MKQGTGTDCTFTDTRRRALSLLRCADTEAGLVNGLAMFAEDDKTPRQGICLANMNGVSGEPQSYAVSSGECTDQM